MQILFTICGRAGSKGVKGKNVKLFCGKPIVYYTLEIYKKYRDKHKEHGICLAVNTDSELLKQQVTQFGIDCVMVNRKEELAGDVVAKADVIRDTLEQVEKKYDQKFDLVVDLDITSPLRTLKDVEGIIELVFDNAECNYAYSVVEARRSPYFNVVNQKDNGFFDRVIPTDFTARQQLPKCFDMNASIYVFEREYLFDLKQERRALIWKMQDTGVLDIDSEQDFEIMQLIVKYLWEKGGYLDLK